MALGSRRTLAARILAIVGLVCGMLGLIAGTSDLVWKFGSTGWFTGGSLLELLALFLLMDGAVSAEHAHLMAQPHVDEPREEIAPFPHNYRVPR